MICIFHQIMLSQTKEALWEGRGM